QRHRRPRARPRPARDDSPPARLRSYPADPPVPGTRLSPHGRRGAGGREATRLGSLMMSRRHLVRLLAVVGCVYATLTFAIQGAAQEEKEKGKEKRKLGYKDTPMLPGGKWHVHDGDRPQPRIITPGTCSTPEAPGKPPSDAVVLFDGTAE